MIEYEFTLTFRLPTADTDADLYVDALAEAGCDDALVGIGQPGRIALDFAREARTAFEAVSSAVQNVQDAIPGVELIEAAPDFVSTTDLAELAGCSRQNLRKLMLSHPNSFPLAVHEGSPSVWHLAKVLTWLQERQSREVDPTLLEVAQTTMQVNIAKEARQLPGVSLPRELRALFR